MWLAGCIGWNEIVRDCFSRTENMRHRQICMCCERTTSRLALHRYVLALNCPAGRPSIVCMQVYVIWRRNMIIKTNTHKALRWDGEKKKQKFTVRILCSILIAFRSHQWLLYFVLCGLTVVAVASVSERGQPHRIRATMHKRFSLQQNCIHAFDDGLMPHMPTFGPVCDRTENQNIRCGRGWGRCVCVCAYACTGNEKCAQHKMYPWCLPACMLLDACSWSTHLCPTNQVNIIQCGQCYFSLLEWMPNGKHYTSFAVLLQQQFWRRRGECERARSEKSPDTRSTI